MRRHWDRKFLWTITCCFVALVPAIPHAVAQENERVAVRNFLFKVSVDPVFPRDRLLLQTYWRDLLCPHLLRKYGLTGRSRGEIYSLLGPPGEIDGTVEKYPFRKSTELELDFRFG